MGTSAINKTAASVSRRKQNWHNKVRATESFDSGMTHYRTKGISEVTFTWPNFFQKSLNIVNLKWKSEQWKRKYSLSFISSINDHSNFWQMGCVYAWKLNVPKRASPLSVIHKESLCSVKWYTPQFLLIIVTRRTREFGKIPLPPSSFWR